MNFLHCLFRMARCCTVALLGAGAAGALAQAYPSKPVRIIVASSPGSGVDILARLVAPRLAEALGQQVIVDNRAGAGGNLGAAQAARTAPDGYSLFMATPAHAISASMSSKAGYDLARDFEPISLLTTGHYMLVVHPTVPAKTVKDLIGLARAKPGRLNYASAGNGNATHLAGELFDIMARVKTTHIPYKGGGHARTELLGGQVDFMFHNITAVLNDVKAGRLRALAVTGPQRALAAPDIPTVSEAALAGYDITSWFGIMAPSGTPADVLARLNREFVRVMGLPDVKEKLASLGSEAVGGPAQAFAAHLRAENEKWSRVIKQAGIRAE
jgi:tripartite-type tricarboxylate transporter receptor subunit TctC